MSGQLFYKRSPDMRIQRTSFVVGMLAASSVAIAAGPGTYLGMGANSPPAANTSALTMPGAGGGSLPSNQPSPSLNNRALDTANTTFADRQFGIERAQTELTMEGIERRRAAEQLELRSRGVGGTMTPSVAAPTAPGSTATAPVTPSEPSGSTVTR